ncbi:MAG: fumarylacetoacetate hydrolase family protein [Candidatus Kariarchaeaceae archaeon]|jgi:2-keto-4-pentenoate hydratase/2-oxohepta-3-ene-1,7-dioic acid hydratase in catechol pathway
MRLATIRYENKEVSSVVTSKGMLPIYRLNQYIDGVKNFQTDLLKLIQSDIFEKLHHWYSNGGKVITENLTNSIIPFEEIIYAPLYRHPSKIWGIGLNYQEHATDLAEISPTTYPVGFMKPDTTIIGQGDTIQIPLLSSKTTGEAELGIVIGKECRNIQKENWLDVVAGFTTILDMTAEDILRQNPRYLGLSKCFNTFFSFGPELVTPDEIENITKLNVSTVLNGEIRGSNSVSNMTFPPDFLVSFHSKIMLLRPGDIISTGTPRAAHLSDGDKLECRIDGLKSLMNDVIDMKNNY